MFEVIPCVDIQQGRAVRLYEGDPARETVYFHDPLDAARHWAELGAKWLHLVDLDAATGRGDNRNHIRIIAETLDSAIQVGGGIRSLEAARQALELAQRVVIGTAAVRNPEVIDALLEAFGPERIAVSLDAKGGRLAIKGWSEVTDVPAALLAERVAAQGVRTVIYTDISRDGTLRGVDPEPIKAMRAAFPHTLLAGGGVASDADLDLYESLGLEGAIVGRALYEGRVRYPRTP
jgi:phosphoribosylformimino-5-aminoimidazole carboxamide ribotide isomerase